MSFLAWQINNYTRGLLVRSVDPQTRGKLRERLHLAAESVHLRSFLDPPAPRGHTLKGSGLVAYKDSRKNSATGPMGFALTRACDKNLTSCGVQPSDYTYGPATTMATTAIVSINGRRSANYNTTSF